MQTIARATALALAAIAGVPACLPGGSARQMSFADDTVSTVGFVAEVGGYIYADVETSPLLLSQSAAKVRRRLLVIDPARAAAGGATAPAVDAILRTVELGTVTITGRLDGTTLVGFGVTDDGSAGTVVTITAGDPLAPVVATTIPLPTGFFGGVTPLPDGNVVVSMRSISDAPIDEVAIMDPRTGSMRSTTVRLSCASWLPIAGRLLCLGPSNSVRTYDYTTDGGLGAVVTARLIPNAGELSSPYPAGAPGAVYWIDGDSGTAKVVSASIGDAGEVTTTGEADIPSVSGEAPLAGAVTLFGPGRALLGVTSIADSGIVVHDFRSTPATLTVTDIGHDFCASLSLVPALGADVFVAGTDATGVRLYRVDEADRVTLLGFVKPPG